MKALILVDIQNDFLPGGALAVKDGDKIIPVANVVIPSFELVTATQDWHPADHKSFASNQPNGKVGDIIELDGLEQVLWPDHCVQGTFGARFASTLDQGKIDRVIQKGTNKNIDSYSGFFDNGKKQDTGLNQYLQSNSIREVYIVGLATDYCVRYTALDAAFLGYKTTVLSDGVKAVNLQLGDDLKAFSDMKAAGIQVITSREYLTAL